MAIDEATAKRRFFLLGLTRLAGVAAMAVALLALTGRAELGPAFVGYVLLITGIALVVIAPTLLVRRWRSPPDRSGPLDP